MADDLVVLHEDAEGFSQSIIAAANSDSGWGPHEVNLARAYLAVVAERDEAQALIDGAQGYRKGMEAKVEAAESELATLDHDFDVAQGEWVIEKAGLKAQLAAMTAERDSWRAYFFNPALPNPEQQIAALQAQLTASEAAREIGVEIMQIMETYRQQEAERGYVDTPGGLEHMGDVWRLLSDWDDRLRALAEPAKAGEP